MNDGEAEVNLTPLIDVVFVILVIFIVVVPILQLDKVMLAKGRQDNTEVRTVSSESAVSIHVRQNNTIWMGKTEIPQERLLPILTRAKEANPEATPQLYHDKRAQFGTYQMVKNAVEEAGFSKMDVILEPS